MSRLKDAGTRLKTEYMFRSFNTSALNAMRFAKMLSTPERQRRQKGLRVSDFALLLVVYKWYHVSEGVKRLWLWAGVTRFYYTRKTASAETNVVNKSREDSAKNEGPWTRKVELRHDGSTCWTLLSLTASWLRSASTSTKQLVLGI